MTIEFLLMEWFSSKANEIKFHDFMQLCIIFNLVRQYWLYGSLSALSTFWFVTLIDLANDRLTYIPANMPTLRHSGISTSAAVRCYVLCVYRISCHYAHWRFQRTATLHANTYIVLSKGFLTSARLTDCHLLLSSFWFFNQKIFFLIKNRFFNKKIRSKIEIESLWKTQDRTFLILRCP